MYHANCLNCNQALLNDQRFCDQCGQTTKTHRLTVAHVAHEYFHAFTHADNGIFYLIKELAKNPGRVAAEYVEGKIKKYYNPFSFLLICVGFFVLINNVIKTYPDIPPPDPKVIQMLPTAAAKEKYISFMERNAAASKAINKHANIITVVAIPLYAFIIWIFFKRRKRNFAEIMVAVILFTAFSSLFTTIFFNPLFAYYKGTSTYFYLFLFATLLQSFYYTWGFKVFLNYRSAGAFIRIWLVIVFTFLLWLCITMLAFVYYVYGRNTFKVIGAMWDQLWK